MNQRELMMTANKEPLNSQKMQIEPSHITLDSTIMTINTPNVKSEKINSPKLKQQKLNFGKKPIKNDEKMITEQSQNQYRTRRGPVKHDQKRLELKRKNSLETNKIESSKYQSQFKPIFSKKQQEKQLDVYLKIVEYLKKIQWDKSTAIHKMNPFQYLTPQCFWFWVCAQFFSLNMGNKKSIQQAAQDAMNKVKRIRCYIPNRLGKTIHFYKEQNRLLQFQTEQLRTVCKPIVQILNDCIPQSNSHGYFDQADKKPQITQISDDNNFRSQLRVTVYNYVKKNCLGHIRNLLQEQTNYLNQNNKNRLPQQNQTFTNKSNRMILEEAGEKEIKLNINNESNQNLKQDSNNMNDIEQTLLSSLSKKTVYSEQDLLLDTVLHLPLDKVISILESSIQETKLPNIQDYLIPLTNDPFELIHPPYPYENKFLDYLKIQKQKQSDSNQNVQQPTINTLEQNVIEDIKCQVCTDGDYTDDNLIVFCATCNISVHQRCVGLAKVPAQSWICEVCHAFGPQGRFLRCPLCTVQGGALKRTTISNQSTLFKDTNPSYHQYLKTCPHSKIKEEYAIPLQDNSEIKLFYDYYDNKPSSVFDQPKCHFVWVHYTCSIWVPECYFEQRCGAINIKGIDSIDKKRYKLECQICHSTKTGAAVKCAQEDCTSHYHPECARTSGVYMEQRYVQSLKYYIYCKSHEPLKLTRVKQSKLKKSKDEIIKFCRGIQKYVQTYKLASVPFKLLKSNKKIKLSKKEQKIKEIKQHKQNDNIDFMQKLKDYLVSGRKLTVNLRKVGDKAFKVIDIQQPVNKTLKSNISKTDDVWDYFVYKNLSSIQMYKKYKKIMKQMVDIKEKFCKDIKNQSKNQKKKDKRKNKQCEQAEAQQDPDQLYCVCRKRYIVGQLMMQCDICEQWYHFKCIGFTGTQDDAGNVIFNCPQCEQYQDKQQIQLRRQKFKDYYIPGFVISAPKSEQGQDSLSDLSSQSQQQQQSGQKQKQEIDIVINQQSESKNSREASNSDQKPIVTVQMRKTIQQQIYQKEEPQSNQKEKLMDVEKEAEQKMIVQN